MAQLRLSPAAARDLEKISDDIAASAGEPVALAFVGRLRRSLEYLAAFPRLGRLRPQFGPGVRSWAFRPYVTLYEKPVRTWKSSASYTAGGVRRGDKWVVIDQAASRFSFANGLRPSHCCMDWAMALSPISSIWPAAISFFTVVMPIHTAVMVRSELLT